MEIRTKSGRLGFLLPVLIAAWGCGGDAAAIRTISAEDLAADIAILASDEFEGRGPSSPGEERTIQVLKGEFMKLGLEPGNGQSYFQDVPLVALSSDPGSGLVIWGAGSTTRPSYRQDYVAWTKRVVSRVSLDRSDMVFVGYGVVAPELGWNDYEGLDVAGKTVVMHFSFAKVGVPSLYVEGGIDHVEHGEEWTLEQRDRYTADDYHKPSDEFDESWDLTGAIDDLILLFLVGHELASSNDWPNWSEGNEFRAIREADMTGGP